MAHLNLLLDDERSYTVPRESSDIEGFCDGYALRRHKFEDKAIEGSLQCREDWLKYIGPIERWGCNSPWEGHFGTVVLPLCKPERLGVISYIFEYAFLYDNVVESAAKSTWNPHGDDISLDDTEYRTVKSVIGTKQIQSKMLLQLLSIDAPCAEVVIDSWKTMVSTTAKQDKSRIFENLDEYVDYRIIDTGAPFVDTLMRFGMGIRLTPEEEERLSSVVKPCYAALGLANDYFSFDVEWEDFRSGRCGESTMTNLVWLFMKWYQIDAAEAKSRVREVTNGYEEEFRKRKDAFLAGEGKGNIKLATYLRALEYQIPGNVAWSIRCPRYHPGLCDEASLMLQRNKEKGLNTIQKDDNTGQETSAGNITRHSSISENSISNESFSWSDSSSRSSISSSPSKDEDRRLLEQTKLGSEHLLGPADYISSLPSKGIREAFIDGLNVWFTLPPHLINQFKSITQTMHNASLMLDDIEDASPLRRGQPATHVIFGAGQTINSANFLLLQAADQVRQLDNQRCWDIFMEETQNLFIGQSFDLYWTRHGKCPSQDEYLAMISQKTGGLLRLITRMMMQKAKTGHSCSLDSLATLLGQFFQIRDDYKNLTEEYAEKKGFCEDLDGGKFSFPLIHALTSPPGDFQLQGILQVSRTSGGLHVPLKQFVLDHLQKAGSMKYTEQTLASLSQRIADSIAALEDETGHCNWVLRLLNHRLKIK
ncbi:geranylgeranyl pyrophosphate synthase [Paecilomyces variotii]|uniref:Geranylgeranyl pyrophosphate synthase n=1 Tax=Byssochlamys spectabilis TaxID=264951 RepID=A0A443I6Q3_BYSSP|nr:geranylgeranyl pyrophosphate synthase [Paecilomyces variotii]KAJ9364273.1 hypothetical protein DTO280E4_2036 [Paecilomyces variotii]RWQ99790.1 geranylgeranyl pyrophosphate synthase [Paecilomyces variotii]